MSKFFYIADTHFGSAPILLYENRPFENVADMERVLIENWNSIVSPDDTVWHLGDFGACGHEKEILSQLNGRVMLVKGNHDTETNEYYRNQGFAEVYDFPVLFQNFWLLSHEPLYMNVNMPYANIFGHIHANPMYKDFSAHHACVCVERTGYAPVQFDMIKKQMAKQDKSTLL